MANIVGYIGTSHVPAIGKAVAQKLQQEPYWKPFFDSFPPLRAWLARLKPDVIVAFYNDHGLNFFLDQMPTFAVGAAPTYSNADEGWGLPNFGTFRGHPELSWHIIRQLVDDEFDPVSCQEMLVDHAFSIPMALLYPDTQDFPVRVVPICLNTVQLPMPSPKRCLALGHSVGRAIRSWHEDLNVVVMGTGGLSHQLDGERAGFINKPFDLMSLDALVNDPQALARLTTLDLVEKAGAQGVELVNWLAARGAIAAAVHEVQRSYHIPISNTAAAVLALEPASG
ncbi:MAG: class III extradiol dioxygenase family protein [Steroidobacteraceae bacterium]